ncbi:MAG TPA: Holliday junction branch migration protein RuvA [Salinivirgaceae bacterium]|nr:Holliday junction branch migration protein RuvA [Salinivirgaceae bacterium]HQA76104.1 Holliday junction branch migration protein RuvA [Salinivirgaceae bacterium]
MFEFIRGRISQITPTFVVVDTGNIGYYINITLNTFSSIQSNGNSDDVKIYIHQVIREDAQLLFGFFDDLERQLFRQLITVSGIGPNTARMMLSSMNPDELTIAISSGDVDALKSIKGIGLKTAQRIIVELKDKLGTSPAQKELFAPSHNTIRDEALSALVMLGFSKKAVETVLNKELKKSTFANVEDLIKVSLKQL